MNPPDHDRRRVFAAAGLWSDAPSSVVDPMFDASRIVAFDEGETVMPQGTLGEFVTVLEGRVRLSINGSSGHEVSYTSADPGEQLALADAILCRPLSVSLVAAERSVVALVPIQSLHDAIAAFPPIGYDMAVGFAGRLAALHDFVRLLDAEVHTRLANFLLLNADSPAGGCASVTIQMSRRELASRLGTVPETLSRAFARLRDDGLIETRGRREVTIIDQAGLEALRP